MRNSTPAGRVPVFRNQQVGSSSLPAGSSKQRTYGDTVCGVLRRVAYRIAYPLPGQPDDLATEARYLSFAAELRGGPLTRLLRWVRRLPARLNRPTSDPVCTCGHPSQDHRNTNQWPQTACDKCACKRFETDRG